MRILIPSQDRHPMCLFVTERQTFVHTAHGVRERSAAGDDNDSQRSARPGDRRNDAFEMIEMFEQCSTDFDDDEGLVRLKADTTSVRCVRLKADTTPVHVVCTQQGYCRCRRITCRRLANVVRERNDIQRRRTSGLAANEMTETGDDRCTK